VQAARRVAPALEANALFFHFFIAVSKKGLQKTMENSNAWSPRRMAQLGFWMGVLLLGALVLAGCTQPPGSASPTPSAGPGYSQSGYSDDFGSVDSASADFAELEDWSGDLNRTGDVDDSDMDRMD